MVLGGQGTKATAQTGAVTLIQCFGSALNAHVHFHMPLDFISRLAALVPKPRVHLTRFHGVFAPNSKYRMQVPEIHQWRLWVGSGHSQLM